MVLLLSLVACGTKLVEGSEKTYYGTVIDRAMSVVNEGDRHGRAYISISTDNEDILFWLAKDCETNAQIGDKVIVEERISKYGTPYEGVFYSLNAQRFIVDNIYAIIALQNQKEKK